MTAVLLLLRRFWPAFAALAVLAALWGWGNHREATGRRDERTKWEAIAAKQAAQAAQDAARQAAAVNAANDDAARSRAKLDTLARQSKETAHVFYKDRPVVRCLDPIRLRAIADADAAATATVAAK